MNNSKEYRPRVPQYRSVTCVICGERIGASSPEVIGGRVKGQRGLTYCHRACWLREQTKLGEEAQRCK